jgi:hypothetical protein
MGNKAIIGVHMIFVQCQRWAVIGGIRGPITICLTLLGLLLAPAGYLQYQY